MLMIVNRDLQRPSWLFHLARSVPFAQPRMRASFQAHLRECQSGPAGVVPTPIVYRVLSSAQARSSRIPYFPAYISTRRFRRTNNSFAR